MANAELAVCVSSSVHRHVTTSLPSGERGIPDFPSQHPKMDKLVNLLSRANAPEWMNLPTTLKHPGNRDAFAPQHLEEAGSDLAGVMSFSHLDIIEACTCNNNLEGCQLLPGEAC